MMAKDMSPYTVEFKVFLEPRTNFVIAHYTLHDIVDDRNLEWLEGAWQENIL